MTVTINDKEYDETKFDDNTRNSIFQVQNYTVCYNTIESSRF